MVAAITGSGPPDATQNGNVTQRGLPVPYIDDVGADHTPGIKWRSREIELDFARFEKI